MGLCIGDYNKVKGMRIQIAQHILLIQQKIAGGAFGDVWKCKQVGTGAILAAKQIKIQNQELSNIYEKQINWLAKLSSIPGVVHYVASKIINSQGRSKKEKIIQTGIIVTEYYTSNLFEQLKNRRLSTSQIIHILTQLLKTLQQIHQLGCLHLDLKLENVLCKLQSSGEMGYYICDFGSCKEGPINVRSMDRKQKNLLKQYIQSCSTLIYRAPEMVQLTESQITGKVDIWMLGCIAYLLLFRKHPFEGQGQLGIITANIDYTAPPQISDSSQHNAVDKIIKGIQGMLQIKVDERLNEQQLLELLNS